jgi:hypothetical protein
LNLLKLSVTAKENVFFTQLPAVLQDDENIKKKKKITYLAWHVTEQL